MDRKQYDFTGNKQKKWRKLKNLLSVFYPVQGT